MTFLDKFSRPRLILAMEITEGRILVVHRLSEVIRAQIPRIFSSSALVLCFHAYPMVAGAEGTEPGGLGAFRRFLT